MPSPKTILADFQRRYQRLDSFWIELIAHSRKELPHLTKFIKKILILLHGNATLERGFSINEKCLNVNQTEKSLVAQRVVYDAVMTAGSVDAVDITKSLIQYARNARSKYDESLEEQKKLDNLKEMDIQWKREANRTAKELQAKRIKLLADAQKDAVLIEEQIKMLQK